MVSGLTALLFIAVVHFPTGKDDFIPSEQDRLLAVVDDAHRSGPIAEAVVAAWADAEYPATKGRSLTRDDERLAKNRADVVKKFLKDHKLRNVDAYSMAVYPSWLARVFRTEEARLKNGELLRDKGGPSTAVVVLRQRGDTVAH